jgi:hypothetical protein
MAEYVVYQVHRDDVDRNTWLRITCDYYDADWLGHCMSAWDDGLYVPTMKIEAGDLDDVFTIGNFMHDTVYPELLTAASSVSIGHVIRNVNDGRIYVVAPQGFKEI